MESLTMADKSGPLMTTDEVEATNKQTKGGKVPGGESINSI